MQEICRIFWSKMCIFGPKCAKLCIADVFLMSDKECSLECKRLKTSLLGAERARFELANQFCRSHAFQACLFSHSSISPFVKRVQNYTFYFISVPFAPIF